MSTMTAIGNGAKRGGPRSEAGNAYIREGRGVKMVSPASSTR